MKQEFYRMEEEKKEEKEKIFMDYLLRNLFIL